MANNGNLPTQIWGAIRPHIIRCSTAFVTLALAAFPAIYTLDPNLAMRPGFWKSARWTLFALWLILLLYAVYRLTGVADRDRKRELSRLAEIDARVMKIDEIYSDLASVAQTLVESVENTRSGFSYIESSARMRRMQERIEKAIESTSSQAGTLARLPVYPEDTSMLVAIHISDDVIDIVYPPDYQGLGGTESVKAMVNLFELHEVRQRKAKAVALGDLRHRLPLPLQATLAAIVAPLLAQDASHVGALIVCSPSELLLDEDVLRGLHERTVNASERIAPIVSAWLRGEGHLV